MTTPKNGVAEMEKDTGGQAFPRSGQIMPNMGEQDGMTLRDWFAGQALMGLLNNAERRIESDVVESLTNGELLARNCYYMADVMLKERQRDGKTN